MVSLFGGGAEDLSLENPKRVLCDGWEGDFDFHIGEARFNHSHPTDANLNVVLKTVYAPIKLSDLFGNTPDLGASVL